MNNKKVIVNGIDVDANTRCSHYHSQLDVIAIKFKCCNEYYACIYCHETKNTHQVVVWNTNEFDTHAILCGNCNTELTINEYLSSKNNCPFCKTAFNPKCSNHYHFYFEIEE